MRARWLRFMHTAHVTRRTVGYRGTAAGLALSAVLTALLMLAGVPARAEFREVALVDDEFQPANLTIRQGDTVVWVHRGQRPHGVRAADGSFESSPGCSFQNGSSCMRSGDRYSRTFDQPGTYSYFCPVHGSANGVGMAGQVTVASSGGGGGNTTTTARPATTTTARPTATTARPTTTAGPAGTQPPGGATTTVAAPSTSGDPAATSSTNPEATIIVPPTTVTDQTTTSLVALPVDDGDSGTSTWLLAIAVVVVLAALVGAAAWYYRPGIRPGGPPSVP